MSTSRRGFFARMAALAAAPFVKKAADAIDDLPDDPDFYIAKDPNADQSYEPMPPGHVIAMGQSQASGPIRYTNVIYRDDFHRTTVTFSTNEPFLFDWTDKVWVSKTHPFAVFKTEQPNCEVGYVTSLTRHCGADMQVWEEVEIALVREKYPWLSGEAHFEPWRKSNG